MMMRSRFAAAWRGTFAACTFLVFLVAGTDLAEAQNVDLVVTIQSDQPAYMGEDLEHFNVTVSNNGPANATNIQLVVHHPAADAPFEQSATCQALPGPNPNGPAICPPSTPFVRSGSSFNVTIQSIPSQSQVLVEFDNAASCINEQGPIGTPTGSCYSLPQGNFTVSADVSSAQNEADATTNHATTNIYIYPPDIQYKIEITDAPVSATPGEVVAYDFEVANFGLQPSNLLSLIARIRGMQGNMTAPSSSNNPYGSSASTLPGTELLSIKCLPTSSFGSYTHPMIFGSLTDYCPPPAPPPIPLPQPTSFSNTPGIIGFPSGNFLTNLPGTMDAPPSGGVMRFRALVKVGSPLCLVAGESGHRNLEFNVHVGGLYGTDTVPPAFADNDDTAMTQVDKNCNEEADIEFTTSATPASVALNGGSGNNGGSATWTQAVTVSNISSGSTAASATQVPVTFGHHSYLFTETRSPVTCASSPAGLCPSSADLAAGVVTDTNTAFKLSTVLDHLDPGDSVTFTQQVTETRTACWGSSSGPVDLRGDAGPSPAVYDPDYLASDTAPLNFTPGNAAYFGNNGMQTLATVTNIPTCSGGGGTTPGGVDLVLEKTGPYANPAATGPLLGQSASTPIADGTTIYFKLKATNPDGANPVLIDDIRDTAHSWPASVLTTADAGFIDAGASLSDWGITCTASPASQTCHELASSPSFTAYKSQATLAYDPTQHGGDTAVPLAPLASLTYVVPFTTPTHLNRCTGPTQVQNKASARFSNPSGGFADTPDTKVNYYVGNAPCTPGTLDIKKTIMAPANSSSIPVSGLISFKLAMSNLSSTDTLDVAHLVDTPTAFGADMQVVNITCASVTNGAKCPTTPIVAGVRTPASGPTSTLPNPYDIDYEWGSAGDNTFPPNSSLAVTVTYQVSNPTNVFSCVGNSARFSGEHDAFAWEPDNANISACPPRAPDLSLQKTVSPQIAPPGSLVTYTLIVTNIGAASADGTQLDDPLPSALLADNPNGYTSVTCTDISGSGFLPNPQGTALCPSVTSNASGLNATIATLGANSALKFTYQALMPDLPVAPLSVDNTATVTPPATGGGLSFNSGTAQSHQNVQVTAGATAPPMMDPIEGPTLSRWAMILLLLALLGLGAWRLKVRQH